MRISAGGHRRRRGSWSPDSETAGAAWLARRLPSSRGPELHELVIHWLWLAAPVEGLPDHLDAGLNELLLSPAIKRLVGIKLRPQRADVDAGAAVSMVGK